MPESNEEEGEVVVVAKRNPKPTPEPRLVINFGEGGAWTNNFIFDYLRSIFNAETDFYIDTKFSADQKKVVIKALSGLSNHSSFASAFEELRKKGVIINIHPATRPDQLRVDEDGRTVGLSPGGTVDNGSIIDIYIRIDRGGPLSLTQISISVVHELIHALGVPAFGARLDAPGSNWDVEIWRDVFRGYNFSDISSSGGGASPIVTDRDGAGGLAGSLGGSIYVGSTSGDVFRPTGGGNAIFTRSGINEIHLSPGGFADRLVNGGGSTVIVVPSQLASGSISVLRSDSGNDLSLVIAGRPELSISNALAAGSMISLQVAGQNYPLSSFATFDSMLPELSYAHIDFFGAYGGEPLGNVALSDSRGIQFVYRLAEISGAYAAEEWSVGLNTGVLSGQFSKPDLGGSEFTFLTVVVSNGVADALIAVTVRWAYSNELSPTL